VYVWFKDTKGYANSSPYSDSVILDTTPPTPDPMTWVVIPYATGMTSIALVGSTASDPTTPVNYYFNFVDSPTGGTGGVDSGWQSGTSYTNSGLGVNHQYGYQVKARDGANNETAYSTPTRYVYTTIETPSGISFGAVTSTSIQVQSANTPSGLNRGNSGLLIENTTNVTSSGWKQDNSFWMSNPLSPNTSYSFRATARNGDGVETDYSPTASKYTLASLPGTAPFSNVTQTCIRANWTADSNPSGTRYFCENLTTRTNSDWIASTSWDSCGLVYGTSYSFRVKAKNADGVETDWISLGSQSTVHLFPFFDDFSTDKGWFGLEPGAWECLPALAGGGENGYPDPETDYSPSDDNYILGFAIGADYPNDLGEKESIISPPIDCTGQDRVFLKFRRWLNVESSRPEPNVEGDHAHVYVSTDGTDWTQVWENPPVDLMDNQWVPVVLDISSYAASQGTLYVKFTMGPTNSSRRFSGWNIDDFEITSEAIYPSEGTYGTEVAITGAGFGSKKGKVLIGTTALTILEWTNESIRCRLAKVLAPGVYDVTIQPSGPKGTPPIIEKEAFVVKAPEIYSIDQTEGSAYDQVTIKGRFFGAKKGKVYLGYVSRGMPAKKSCSVLTWGDDEIVFTVPNLPNGVYDVIITNSVNSDTLVGALKIE
jgi:hypothetical protein